jgi:HEAT repeat protein
MLKDDNPKVRYAAANVLRRFPNNVEIVKPLMNLLDDDDRLVRQTALYGINNVHVSAITDDDLRRQILDINIRMLKENTAPDRKAYNIREIAISYLSKSRDERALEALLDLLNSPHCNLAGEVASALGKKGDKRAVEPLINAFKGMYPLEGRCVNPRNSYYTKDRFTAAIALSLKDSSPAPVIDMLKDDNPDIRREAAFILSKFPNNVEIVKPLMKLLDDDDTRVRYAALAGINNVNDSAITDDDLRRQILDINIRIMKDNPQYRNAGSIKSTAINYLTINRDERAFETLIEFLKDSDCGLAASSAQALWKKGDKRAVEPLINALKSRRECNGVRDRASGALVYNFKDSRAIPAMLEIVKDDDADISLRSSIAFNFGELGDPSVLDELKIFMKGGKVGEPDRVRASLRSAIKRLSYIKEGQKTIDK